MVGLERVGPGLVGLEELIEQCLVEIGITP